MRLGSGLAAATAAIAAAAAAALWTGGMDSHKLPNLLEAALPPHHRATKTWRHGRFDNIWPDTWEERSFSEVLRWNKERRASGLPSDGHLSFNKTPTAADWAAAFPAEAVDAAALAAPPADAVQATWVGHSTALVQMEGVSFLTDPIFSARCSPVQWLGPRRVAPPALEVRSLPHVDFVVISHNHYDHLDLGSVKALHARFGHALAWYVPLGLRPWFKARGITNVTELDWWQEAAHGGVRVALTPAQHWSIRTPWSRKQSLWGGWAVLGPRLRFWFTGDTGYCSVFPEIGERYGPFDLSLIPTGAYAPRWFMRPQHTDPGEAVAIHQEVRSMRSVACHLATFSLTDEPMDEPVRRLPEEVAKAGLKADSFVTLRHGATIRTAGGVDFNTPSIMLLPKLP